MDAEAETLAWLHDREEIRQLMIAYSRAADCGSSEERAERLSKILTQDAEVQYSFGTVSGRDNIIAKLNDIIGTFLFTHHIISNDTITINGEEATGLYLVTAAHGPNDGPIFWAGARYTQTLVRTSKRWRIKRHSSQSLWNSNS